MQEHRVTLASKSKKQAGTKRAVRYSGDGKPRRGF